MMNFVIVPDAILESDIGHLKAGTLLEIDSLKTYINALDYHCNCVYYQNNDIQTIPRHVQVHSTEMRIQNMNRLKFLAQKLHSK